MKSQFAGVNRKISGCWRVGLILVLLGGLLCLGGLLFSQSVGDSRTVEIIPVDLKSQLEADYRFHPNARRIPAVRFSLIWEALRDREPGADDLAERQFELLQSMTTPVPFAAPQACRGSLTLQISQDSWLDSGDPAARHDSELLLRLGREGDQVSRVFLFVPLDEAVPPSSFVHSAFLELSVVAGSAPPQAVRLFNLAAPFTDGEQPQLAFNYGSLDLGSGPIHTLEITPLVRDWVSGRFQNYGLLLEPQRSSPPFMLAYHSRETAGASAPRLIVNCSPVQRPPTAIAAVSATATTPIILQPEVASPPLPSTPTPKLPPTVLPSGTPAPPPLPPSPTSLLPSTTPPPKASPPTKPSTTPENSEPPTATSVPAATAMPPATPTVTVPPTATSIPLPAEADLALSKSAAPDPVGAGDQLTYSLIVTNLGPAEATGVTLRDTLPAAVSFGSASSGCTLTGGTVMCDLGRLPNGDSRQITIVVTVPAATADGTVLNNTANVTGHQADPVASNNSASTSTTVTGQAADLSVTKAVNTPNPLLNDPVTFTVTINNAGPNGTTNVQLTDPLPASLNYLFDVPSRGSYSSPNGLWDVGELAANETVTLTVVASATSLNRAINVAEVTASGQPDPDSTPGNGLTSEDDQASVEVSPTLPGLAIDDVSVLEGDSGTTPANFTVTLSAPFNLPVTVDYASADNTAEAASDYLPISGTLTFPASTTSQSVTVQVQGDTSSGVDETFFVNLSRPTNATISDGQGMGTIVNDDSDPLLCSSPTLTLTAIADAPLDSQAGQQSSNFGADTTLTLKPGPDDRHSLIRFDVSAVPPDTVITCVNLLLEQTTGGSAQQTIFVHRVTADWNEFEVSWLERASGVAWSSPGGDFEPAATANFVPDTAGQQVIDLTTLARLWADNPTANFGVLLRATTSGSNGLIPYSSREVANPAQRPRLVVEYLPVLSITDVAVTEGDSGSTNAIFTVTLSPSATQPITVTYTSADNSATAAGADYQPVSGIVTFAPGVTSQPITVPINGDSTSEPDETFFINLSSPFNATISAGQAIGTIRNDD